MLRFDSFLPDFPVEKQRLLSIKADMKEAAKNLFACMRNLTNCLVKIFMRNYCLNEDWVLLSMTD